ncbi:hypothetical protein GDO81_002473 [Engystomops pustulosus]|uniref:Testis expressed 43 n=1 Tax=Engystomops pustulosus TaxID=76066 RepID=A0AAV7DKG6_ENGPU|nr:hypothetical protein GDO81_002473 [Engystomops pustulosus]
MSESCSRGNSVDRQKYRHQNENLMINIQKGAKQEDRKDQMQNLGTMVSIGTITDMKGLAHSHVPEFSERHPIIPKRYVMPWKQDMENRKLLTRHADLAGLYRGPQEESLFWQNKERLCHGEEHHNIMKKIKMPSQHHLTDFPLHSHLSRYQSYKINQKTRMLGSYE